ncbi:MAG: hypothetical protein GY715_01320 [Planctomycetes bacterium]|nr:hypothetical protein [Planctomycetota bacterium]
MSAELRSNSWCSPMRLAVASVPVMCFAGAAFAHLRWFVTEEDASARERYVMDTTSVLVLVGALCVVAVLWVVQRQSRRWPFAAVLEKLSRGPETLEWRLIAFLGGLMLLDNVRTGVFLAPNLVLPGPTIAVVGAIAQALLAVILILQISFVVSGVLIIVALLLAGIYFPAPILLDYLFEFCFLAAALVAIGPRLSAIDRRIYRALEVNPQRWAPRALPLIRIGVGLTLVTLAIHNKLISPGLALAFLAEHDFNFMPRLGFSEFTDLHFAFAAGVGELVLGILLIAGIATRAIIFILACFFVSTVIALGPMELTGHLPIFGIAILLLVRGSGRLRGGPSSTPVSSGSSLRPGVASESA